MRDEVLLLDIGNTRLKWAKLEGGNFITGGELLHLGRLDNGILMQVARNISPQYVFAACVAGNENMQLLQDWGRQQFHREIEFVEAVPQKYGVINGYADPSQLGSDRWAAIIAAHQKWQDNVCVIDAGTALTLDLIEVNGRHLGGYILPGLGMMQECLLSNTEIPISTDSAILPKDCQLGNSTVDCISNGALQAACGLVERTIKHFEHECNEAVQCVLTGGDAQRLADNLSTACILEPDLVLQGIGHIASSELLNK